MNDPVFTIYKITGKCGRAYIGITRMLLSARWRSHQHAAKCGQKSPLYDAMRECGAAAFSIAAICECYSVREAITCESAMIGVHDTYWKRGGLNKNLGGGGNVAGGLDAEICKRIGEKRKAYLAANDNRRFVGALAYNAKGRPISAEGARRKAEGRKHAYTPERVAARAEKLRARWADPVIAEQMRRDARSVIAHEKALAYRVGRERPYRYRGER